MRQAMRHCPHRYMLRTDARPHAVSRHRHKSLRSPASSRSNILNPSEGPHTNASKRTLSPVSHAYVLSLLVVQNVQIHPRFDFPQWDLAVRSITQPNLFCRVHAVVVNLLPYVQLLHRDPTVLQHEPETLEGITILVVPLAFRDVEEMLNSLYDPPFGYVAYFILKGCTFTLSCQASTRAVR
jgi:hypothetical protein